MAAGTITCTMCGSGIPVDFQRASLVNHGVVNLRMDMGPLEEHMRACAAGVGATSAKQVERHKPGTTVSPVELAGRIGLMLEQRHFIAKGGSRACTMCGMSGESCMALIGQNTRQGCCKLCMDGNTHRAPQDDQDCAHWAVVHAPKH